jgi:heterodisulfide reductase subunit A-like polyferredoxin
MRYFTSVAAVAVVTVTLLSFAGAAPDSSHKPYDMNPSSYKANHVIKTDVVIIGGGGTGIYAAIQLKDQGKKIMVIESKSRLGGHTETYHDPETNRTMGKQNLYEISVRRILTLYTNVEIWA